MAAAGSPAGKAFTPRTGTPLRIAHNNAAIVVVDRLDRPTSLDFSGDTALIANADGQIWRIAGVSTLDGSSATREDRP